MLVWEARILAKSHVSKFPPIWDQTRLASDSIDPPVSIINVL